MDKIYHVFVSSTYSDLRNERSTVSEAIAKADYVAEGMELFTASSQKQLSLIKRIIDRCDYYIVIVGGRYGSLADGNVSYTELEYDYAIERGIPTLAFLHDDPESIETGKSEKKQANKKKLKNFRVRLEGAGMVDYWINADDLATKVVVAIGKEVTVNPGTGWVRGDKAADPKLSVELADQKHEQVVDENEKLKREVVALKKEVAGLRAKIPAAPGGDMSDATVQVLVYLFGAESEDCDVKALEQHFQFVPSVAKYHLDELNGRGLAEASSGNYMTGQIFWGLTGKGRRYVMENGLNSA